MSALEAICSPPPLAPSATNDLMTWGEYFWFCMLLRQPHNEPAPRQLLWTESPTSWIPLDASAALWNRLIRKLSVPEGTAKEGLRFETLDSIENRGELRQKYKNIHALIIALPMEDTPYMNQRSRTSEGGSIRHAIPFFEQTIDGACGFHAIVHALCHGPPASMLDPGTNNLLTDLLVLSDGVSMTADNYAVALELNKPLEEAYTDVAIQGDLPFAPEEPAIRYICMVKSFNGNLYHLDAKRNRPGNMGPSAENVLSDKCLDHVNRMIRATTHGKPIAIMALISGQRPKEQKQNQAPPP